MLDGVLLDLLRKLHPMLKDHVVLVVGWVARQDLVRGLESGVLLAELGRGENVMWHGDGRPRVPCTYGVGSARGTVLHYHTLRGSRVAKVRYHTLTECDRV